MDPEVQMIVPGSRAFTFAGLAALAISGVALAQEPAKPACIEVGGGSTAQFEGKLTHHVFAGPPNYEDVRKGDTPEPGFILTLPRKLCVTSKTDEMLQDDEVKTIHVIPDMENTPGASTADLRRFIGQTVMLTGKDGHAAYAGHHRAPLVLSLVRVEASVDPTASYGTAQTTVEAFYSALAAGDGAAASSMMVPAKRSGPFAPAALSAFYGRLAEPLRLLGVSPVDPGTYEARYTFVSGKRRCNGLAIVRTAKVGGFNLIDSIRAKNGC